MASSMVSARNVVLTALLASLVALPSFAADGIDSPWYEQNQPCSSCYEGSQTGSACFDGIDVPYCGDMSPTAMCPGGQWYFQSNLIAIRRHATQNEVFQKRNVNSFVMDPVGDPTGTLIRNESVQSVLSTDDLTFQNSAGYRLLLGWKLAEKYAVEFSYFDLKDWDEAKAVSDATVYAETVEDLAVPIGEPDLDLFGNPIPIPIADHSLFSPFSGFGNPPNTNFDYNDLASIRYRSSLDNVELNVRHWVTKHPSRLAVSVLWGGRHNAVREQFTYFSTSPGTIAAPALATNTVNTWTQNDLWGAQIGAQVDFCWDPGWHTEFEIKGGVAHNKAVMEGLYEIQGAPAGGYGGRVDKDITSWIGELRLTLVYQFGQHLTTHIGYEALVLSRMAIASQNFETDLSILADSNQWVLNNGGSVVYHGPSAGLTFAW